jgi:hypothetical protein
LIAERIREYEVVMILSPEATEEEIAAAIERVDGLITGGGGTVGEHNNWGLKRLSGAEVSRRHLYPGEVLDGLECCHRVEPQPEGLRGHHSIPRDQGIVANR